ncbi:MAG TPA: alanine--tRNA ligase, partial [Chitinophagaceae bacterium]
EKITGKKYEGGDTKQDIAFRVLADHIRAISFTIADGQLPSNTGAGYVIRRILRRAVRYYYSYLDHKQPLLHDLVPVLAEQFRNVFPELYKQLDFVKRVVREEEDAFLRTLGKGVRLFGNYIKTDDSLNVAESSEDLADAMDLKDKDRAFREKKMISGNFAFLLNDTYGFPIDLTNLMAREQGWTVDMDGFSKNLLQQKERSRAATTLDTEDWVIVNETNSSAFVGYDSLETETSVTRYRKIKTKGKEAFQLVLQATPFYAESGGQVGDTGTLEFNGEKIKVTDTKKENDLIVHMADKLPSDITTGVHAKVDGGRRRKIAIHHSATHLLHAALRKVLGTHVAQKGSLVNDEHLRFDFSHFSKVNDEEMRSIEAMVNEKIRENIPVVIKQMPKEEALATGAMALFGEKYSDIVRVVIIDPAYSIELCGGTHVGNTGELGFFRIVHETAIAAGVRRIEAISGKVAEEHTGEELKIARNIREALKNPKEPVKAIESLLAENSELKKKIEKLEAKQLSVLRAELVKSATALNGANFLGAIVEVNSADALKKLCFDLKKDLSNYLVVLAANVDGKPQIAVMLDEALATAKNLEAPKIIKEHIAPLIKGGGGGQKTLATAGGQDASNLPQVIEKVKSLLQ